MATDMTGLFGPTPDEIAQQQQANLQNQAYKYAELDPFQRATAGIYQGAGMLAGAGARALGGVSPQEQMARQTQGAMSGLDLSTPEGLMEASKRMQTINPSLAVGLAERARNAAATVSKTAYESAQASQKESQAKLDASRAALADARAAALERDDNFKNLPPAVQAIMLKSKLPPDSPALPEITKWIEQQSQEKPVKDSADIALVKEAAKANGLTEGTPAYNAFLAKSYAQLMDKKTHITVANTQPPMGTDAADLAIDMYRKGDPSMMTGWGRDPKNKAMIINRMAERVKNGEFAPADLVNAKVALAGATSGSRALGTQEALMGTGGEELMATIPLVKHYATATNPTDYPVLNAAGLYVAKNTGDENQAGLASSLNTLVNVYARAISPKAPTVSDKNHAREIINQAMSTGQLNTVTDVMKYEAEVARSAPENVRKRLSGQAAGTVPSPALPALPGSPLSPDQFNAQWATATKGTKLVGPDDKTYTKK